MNLVWLKYVSYACVVGAVFFYSVIRLNRLALSRTAALGGYVACIVLACVAWHVQESNTEQHSPRGLMMGTVTWVSASSHKGGSIDDDFQMRIEGGALSPKFSAYLVADSRAQQPIHVGDMLGVLYRTWDDVPVTIDELQGQQPGWHYRRFQALSPYVWTVGGVGFFAFLGALAASRRRGGAAVTSGNGIDLSGS